MLRLRRTGLYSRPSPRTATSARPTNLRAILRRRGSWTDISRFPKGRVSESTLTARGSLPSNGRDTNSHATTAPTSQRSVEIHRDNYLQFARCLDEPGGTNAAACFPSDGSCPFGLELKSAFLIRPPVSGPPRFGQLRTFERGWRKVRLRSNPTDQLAGTKP